MEASSDVPNLPWSVRNTIPPIRIALLQTQLGRVAGIKAAILEAAGIDHPLFPASPPTSGSDTDNEGKTAMGGASSKRKQSPSGGAIDDEPDHVQPSSKRAKPLLAVPDTDGDSTARTDEGDAQGEEEVADPTTDLRRILLDYAFNSSLSLVRAAGSPFLTAALGLPPLEQRKSISEEEFRSECRCMVLFLLARTITSQM
jgi:hypothetical protein